MVLMESERRVEDSTEEYSEEIKDLVIARLSALPSNIVISIGSAGTFSARDLVKKIRAGRHGISGRTIGRYFNISYWFFSSG